MTVRHSFAFAIGCILFQSWRVFTTLAASLTILTGSALMYAQTCDSSSHPCINPLHVGDTTITGGLTLTSGKVTAGTQVDIKLDGTSLASPQWTTNGTFSKSLTSPLSADNQQVEVDQSVGTGTPLKGTATVMPAAPSTGTGSSLYTLGLAGINATGSSSSSVSQQYFAEFDLLSPLPWLGRGLCPWPTRPNYTLTQKCWVWLNPRIASVPSGSSAALSSLTSSTSLTTGIGSQSISQITQSFEFQGGVEYYLVEPWNGRQFGLNQTWSRTSPSFIVGGGSVTPFSAAAGATEYGLNNNLGTQFNQNPTLSSLYPQLGTALCSYGFKGNMTASCPNPLPTTAPTTVAFVFPNRSRFYRDFYAGLRLRTFYFNGDCGAEKPTSCKVANIFPGTFDLRFGEDETVTAGKLVPFVITLTGSYPIPIPGSGGAIRIFGSSYIRTHSNKNTEALVLVPSSSFTSLDNTSVVVQQIQPADADYFRLGVGVDLVQLIGKWAGSK
jgi:hypothetical protein